MQATDFIYDGVQLSDLGYMICTFDNTGVDNVTAGSNITFDVVMQHNGAYYAQTGSTYGECFTTSFDICKYRPNSLGEDISLNEFRFFMSWLNRKEYCTFSLIDSHDSGWNNIYFDGSFNIERINFHGRLIGLTLTFQSNRPFGYGAEIIETYSAVTAEDVIVIDSKTDELGALYPDTVEITCQSDGDLEIFNQTDNRLVSISNCTLGEVITMKCFRQMISSSDTNHKLYEDFNFNFFRLMSTYNNRENIFLVSIPCDITIKYHPVRKVVF